MNPTVSRGKDQNYARQNPMTKKQAARPSIFTHEFADQICDQLASGMNS